MGDVDDDGMILAFDAALTLQYSVGFDPLSVDPLPWENWRDSTANVDGIDGITANDAGLILQYSAGIISSFSGGAKKSLSFADVTIEIVDKHIVFYSHGDLLGLNLSTTDKNQLLGVPVTIGVDFLSAFNIHGSTYNLGLCTATPPEEGSAIMKIPFNQSGTVSFKLLVNTEEKIVTVDLSTGVVELEKEIFSIYPNPVNDRLIIHGVTEEGIVRIFTLLGQQLYAVHMDGPHMEIDVSDLSTGIYSVIFDTKISFIWRWIAGN